MAEALNKHFRVDEDFWRPLEATARDRETTPNWLLIDLATQALDDLEWPRIEVRMLHSRLFTAQAIARDMIAAGREDKLEKICRDVSRMAPELPGEATKPAQARVESSDSSDGEKAVLLEFLLTLQIKAQ